jgi:hypothetical protein
MRDRTNYMNDVAAEIQHLEQQAAKAGLKLCVRLNG